MLDTLNMWEYFRIGKRYDDEIGHFEVILNRLHSEHSLERGPMWSNYPFCLYMKTLIIAGMQCKPIGWWWPDRHRPQLNLITKTNYVSTQFEGNKKRWFNVESNIANEKSARPLITSNPSLVQYHSILVFLHLFPLSSPCICTFVLLFSIKLSGSDSSIAAAFK